MQQKQKLNLDAVYKKCSILCEKCANCIQKYTILPMKNGNNKNIKQKKNIGQTKDKLFSSPSLCLNQCDMAMALFNCAKEAEASASTQLERVEAYHVVVTLIEQNCAGEVASEARRMLEHEWIRVLLYTHEALPNLTKIIEDIIDDRALAKTLGLGLNIFKEDTYSQVEQILKFLERKRNLCALYNLVSDCVEELSPKSKEMANIRFFKRLSAAQAAEKLSLGQRTVQRRTERMLDEMRPLLKKHDLEPDSMLWWLGEREPWVLEWFRL